MRCFAIQNIAMTLSSCVYFGSVRNSLWLLDRIVHVVLDPLMCHFAIQNIAMTLDICVSISSVRHSLWLLDRIVHVVLDPLMRQVRIVWLHSCYNDTRHLSLFAVP